MNALMSSVRVLIKRALTQCVRSLFPTARGLLVRKSMRSKLGMIGTGDVLVVGCGRDPYRPPVKSQGVWVAMDLFPVKGAANVAANASAAPFMPKSFDFVLCTEVLEHVLDPGAVVAEIYRVLRPGGRVFLTVPFMFHVHADPDDHHRFSPSGLRNLFSEYDQVSIVGQGTRVHVISDLVTTAFPGMPFGFPLRVLNHLLARLPGATKSGSTAPSGYFVEAVR